jgi:hypothetical protein
MGLTPEFNTWAVQAAPTSHFSFLNQDGFWAFGQEFVAERKSSCGISREERTERIWRILSR